MDSSGEDAPSAPDSESLAKGSILYLVLRCSVALLLPVIFFFAVSFSIGFLAVLLGSFSVPTHVPLPSQCRIVSSSVDIRSAKVCQLGLLNYSAKNVFSPSEKRKFRCHFDYYWASVFKVMGLWKSQRIVIWIGAPALYSSILGLYWVCSLYCLHKKKKKKHDIVENRTTYVYIQVSGS